MSGETGAVFIVDDDASVRTGLERLLRAAGHDAETFSSAREYLEREAFEGIGCLLLDVAMPGMSGLELQSMLFAHENAMPVVFLTGHGDIPASVQAMKLGAEDFLTKPVDEDTLLSAISAALDRHRQLVAERRHMDSLRHRFATLSPRELEVMHLVVSGLMNKQVAAQLGISEKTVKVHRARVMEKTGSHSLAELVRLFAAASLPIERKPN